MELYKFFNSAPGDPRTYQAADFADYFGSVLSTGLLHTDNVPGMQVSVETGTLNTVVSAGKAIMDGHLYENTAPLTLTHSLPEATLDRIDRVVLRLDLRNAERNIKLHVKEGVASATPVAPTLQRDNVIYEISLAQILVRKNTVQLLAGDLTDERLDEALCGLVYSLISIPTSQFQAEWDAFMAGITDSGFASGAEFAAHEADTANPHAVTKTQVGLSNLDNVQQIPLSQKGVVGGVVPYDASGNILKSDGTIFNEGGAWKRIVDITLTSDVAFLDIVVDPTFKSFKIVSVNIKGTASGAQNLNVKFNDVTTGYMTIPINGTAATSGTTLGIAGRVVANSISSSTSYNEFVVSNAFATTFKVGHLICNYNEGNDAFNIIQGFTWKNNTDLISKITLSSALGSMKSNSRFVVLGLK